MSVIGQAALTIGLMANTISILMLIRHNCRLHSRIVYIEVELYTQKFLFTQLRKVENVSGIPSMAEDTEVAE